MVGALHQDLGGDERPPSREVLGIALLPGLDPALDHHRDAMGDLLAGLPQDLLADELHGHSPLGLVRERLVLELPLPGRGVPLEEAPEGVEVQPELRADRHDLAEIHQVLVLGDLLKEAPLGEQVELVQEQVDRLPGVLQALGQIPLAGAEEPVGIHDPEQQVGLLHGRLDVLEHPLVQDMLGLVDAGRVQEGQLHVSPVHNPEDASAGGLGRLADGRQLLPDQGIEEGRLARVGKPDDRDGRAASHDGCPSSLRG